MPIRTQRLLIFVLIALSASGCTTLREGWGSVREGWSSFREGFASWREAFWRDAFEDPARVDRITAGTMTRRDVRELLGEPHQMVTLNGEETWTYKSYRTLPKSYVPLSNAKSGSMQSLAVRIEFTRDGIVKRTESEKLQW
jgi:outer membrane protein assembly factor BamE (lipoprotein component of BamABCDE complex)